MLNESCVVQRDDGTLLINMRSSGSGFRAVAVSRDQGLRWSEPTYDEQLPCPTCQASLLEIPNGGLLFSNPSVSSRAGYSAPARRNLVVRWSADGGNTWPKARVLCPGPSAYSDLAVLPDGDILCLYECGETRYSERLRLARFDLDWLKEHP
jgi:sialidase-1